MHTDLEALEVEIQEQLTQLGHVDPVVVVHVVLVEDDPCVVDEGDGPHGGPAILDGVQRPRLRAP